MWDTTASTLLLPRRARRRCFFCDQGTLQHMHWHIKDSFFIYISLSLIVSATRIAHYPLHSLLASLSAPSTGYSRRSLSSLPTTPIARCLLQSELVSLTIPSIAYCPLYSPLASLTTRFTCYSRCSLFLLLSSLTLPSTVIAHCPLHSPLASLTTGFTRYSRRSLPLANQVALLPSALSPLHSLPASVTARFTRNSLLSSLIVRFIRYWDFLFSTRVEGSTVRYILIDH